MAAAEHGRDDPQRVAEHLAAGYATYPELRRRITQALLIELHRRGNTTVDEIHDRARRRALRRTPGAAAPDANAPTTRRLDRAEWEEVQRLTSEQAARAFSIAEIDDTINLVRKREEAQSLEEIANVSNVSFGLLARRVKDFCRLPEGQTQLPEQDSVAVRVALIRRFISEHLEFIGVAKHHLRIRDFDDLVDRIVGDEEGLGVIGGKAAGMLLGAKILSDAQAAEHNAPQIEIRVPESFYLRSDVIEQFLAHNGLSHFQDQKYKPLEEIRRDYPMVVELFKNAEFPPAMVARMRTILERLGDDPLIVRSSSLLEDRFRTAFAGKYRSVFVANQGDFEDRLHDLLGAIAEVYASILHPDPISYRRRHQLLDYSENMAILIQRLAGRRAGRYFFPVWAGVAVSHNFYRRNPRVRPDDGLARLVFGFGTRAVDRVSRDFPRLMPLGVPTLRPEIKARDIVHFSQREADAIDLEQGRLRTLPLDELLAGVERLPGIAHVCSTFEEGFMRPLVGDTLLGNPADLVVTFDRLAQSPYPTFLRWALQRLEQAYGTPVDIEFAYDGEHFYFLQCRPQSIGQPSGPVALPVGLEPERKIFSARRDIMTGSVHGIDAIVLVDPQAYTRLPGDEQRLGVAQLIHRLNHALAERRFVLMGPGRWGSRDLRMGVRVGYADINQTRMLIELADTSAGQFLEASFGSHFFHDLMESDIRYLALYPQDEHAIYNTGFLHETPNALTAILPDADGWEAIVRVIDIPRAARGLRLNVDMDGDHQRALGYLAPVERAAHETDDST